MAFMLIGWLGTLLYLVNHAYISINQHWQKSIYYGGNALAATCLIVSSFVSQSWQAVFINSFWAVISIALYSGIDLSKLKLDKRFFHLIIFGMLTVFIGQYLLNMTLNWGLLGWASAFIFSGCYLLFSAEKMLPRFYLCWNAFAAVILLPQLWLDQNWPVFGLEIVWAIISLYGAGRRFQQVHLIQ